MGFEFAMKRFFLLALLCQSAGAATLDWPSSGCASTLQACINAAASGDTVRITTEALISESLDINKSLTLAARGTAALFSAGSSISLTAVNDGVNITLSNLRLSEGAIFATIGSSNASHAQSLRFENLRVEAPSSTLAALQISQVSGANSNYTINLERSYLSQNNATGAAVFIDRLGAGNARPTINVLNNQMQIRGSGVVSRLSAHGGVVNISGNRIGRLKQLPIGGTISAGVFVGVVDGGTMPATLRVSRNVIHQVDSAVVIRATEASLSANVLNNTFSVSNIAGLTLDSDAGNSISGRVANNIVDRPGNCGLEIMAGSSVSLTHNFNLYSQSSSPYCGTAAGANDRNETALFRGQFDFRARSGSAPQVNAGSNSDQPQTFLIVPIPLPDIDGRSGRVGGTVDIGAHERSFDQSFEQISAAGNVISNLTRLQTPPVGLLVSDLLSVSQYGRELNGVSPLPLGAANHTGVWFSAGTGLWNIFNQNTSAPMALGRRFFVLLNVDSQSSFIHTANSTNSSFNLTTLNNSALNNQPDAFPIVTQHWDVAQTGTGTYNDSSIGVWFDSAINRWRIFNQQPSVGIAPSMPDGAAFNVLIPNPLFAAGSHAFRTETLAVPVAVLNLSHPLLDNIECAHPFVTAVYNPNNVYVPSNLVLSYNPASEGRGQWAIERGDGQAIPAGAAFHVYVDPERSRQCKIDSLLLDGFE